MPSGAAGTPVGSNRKWKSEKWMNPPGRPCADGTLPVAGKKIRLLQCVSPHHKTGNMRTGNLPGQQVYKPGWAGDGMVKYLLAQ